ncbi:protease inhibitor I42 family protein [Candidatus Poribacteria bacterium]
MFCLYRAMHSLLFRAILLLLAISMLSCGDRNTESSSDNPTTASVGIGIVTAPGLSVDEITSARLIITADNMRGRELELTIDQENEKATGVVNIPPGNNRLLRAEVYTGNILRYMGERRMDIYADTFVEIHLKPVQEETFYRVQVGKTFIISVGANPSTGYEWLLEFDSEMLELVSREFISDSRLIGAPGSETIEFMGLEEGQAEVIMIYKRPWEAETLSEQVVSVEILPVSDLPLLSLSLRSLDLGMMGEKSTFIVSNSGSGVLTWNINRDLPGWLDASPMDGRASSGQRISVSVRVNREGLASDTYHHTISVTSNGGTRTIPVAMSIP